MSPSAHAQRAPSAVVPAVSLAEGTPRPRSLRPSRLAVARVIAPFETLHRQLLKLMSEHKITCEETYELTKEMGKSKAEMAGNTEDDVAAETGIKSEVTVNSEAAVKSEERIILQDITIKVESLDISKWKN